MNQPGESSQKSRGNSAQNGGHFKISREKANPENSKGYPSSCPNVHGIYTAKRSGNDTKMLMCTIEISHFSKMSVHTHADKK